MLSESQKEEYLRTLREMLAGHRPQYSMVQEIKKFVSNGMDQSTVMQLLKIIHESATPQDQDLIEGVMDLVVGYCTPDKRIFPDKDWP